MAAQPLLRARLLVSFQEGFRQNPPKLPKSAATNPCSGHLSPRSRTMMFVTRRRLALAVAGGVEDRVAVVPQEDGDRMDREDRVCFNIEVQPPERIEC